MKKITYSDEEKVKQKNNFEETGHCRYELSWLEIQFLHSIFFIYSLVCKLESRVFPEVKLFHKQ